jgi:hypothetical protein
MHGSFDDLLAFQKRKFPADVMTMERIAELWVKKKSPDAGEPVLL